MALLEEHTDRRSLYYAEVFDNLRQRSLWKVPSGLPSRTLPIQKLRPKPWMMVP